MPSQLWKFQAFPEMPSHFWKCVISAIACNIYTCLGQKKKLPLLLCVLKEYLIRIDNELID